MRRPFASYLLALSFLPSVTSKGLAETDGFTTIDFPGASFTSAQGINPRGEIVGNYSIAGVLHGYRLSRGGEFRSIDFPDASSSFAREINPRGDIVGAYVSAGVFQGNQSTQTHPRSTDNHNNPSTQNLLRPANGESAAEKPTDSQKPTLMRRDRLGGVLHEYESAACTKIQFMHRTGVGNTNDAANFVCKAP